MDVEECKCGCRETYSDVWHIYDEDSEFERCVDMICCSDCNAVLWKESFYE